MSRFGKGTVDTDTGINLLLEAERRAKTIIQQARREKQNRIREAREEGNSEVAELKEAKERGFQQWVETQSAVEEDEEELNKTTEVAIEKVKGDAAANREAVIKLLLDAVASVNTEFVDNSKKL